MEETQASPFQIVTVKLKLMLAPVNIGNIINGAKSALDRLIFRYNKNLKATIISYFNLKLVEKEVPNFYDSPYLTVPIMVSLMVFRPAKGQLIHGTVKRVSSTHLSLLVFGVISASIIKADLPKDLLYDHSSNTFVDKNNNSNLISLGTKILFRVKDVLTDKNYITINGQMTDSDTYITGHEEIKVETPKKPNHKQNNLNNETPIKLEHIENFKDDEDEKVEKQQDDEKKKDNKKKEQDSEDSSEESSEDEKEKKKSKKSKKDEKSNTKKKSKKDESSESESSESESSEDEKEKKKKKSKKSKKEESSSSSSSESEKEKSKKKKRKSSSDSSSEDEKTLKKSKSKK